MFGEIPRQEIADLALVVDHQDVGEDSIDRPFLSTPNMTQPQLFTAESS
jgi:hypothetical protein